MLIRKNFIWLVLLLIIFGIFFGGLSGGRMIHKMQKLQPISISWWSAAA